MDINNMKKTLLNRTRDIFNLLDQQNEPIYKSELRTLGLGAKSADRYIELIEFIQSQPKIKVTRIKNNVFIELEK